MQRSDDLILDVENIDFQCFLRCPKCHTAFTDKFQAHAAYLCSHFFCYSCLSVDCCPECCALLSPTKFRKIVPESARIKIIKIFKITDNYEPHPPEMVRRIKNAKPMHKKRDVSLLDAGEKLRAADITSLSLCEYSRDNLEIRDKKLGETKFHQLCKKGKLAEVVQAIELRPNLDSVCNNGISILFDLVQKEPCDDDGNKSMINLLLDNGALAVFRIYFA